MPLQNDVTPIKEFQDQTNKNWLQAQIREQIRPTTDVFETFFQLPILSEFGQ